MTVARMAGAGLASVVVPFTPDQPAETLVWLSERRVLDVASHYHQFAILLQYAEAALKLRRPVEAGWALHFAAELQGPQAWLPEPFQLPALAHHPLWHTPLRGRTVMLMRPQREHSDFLARLLDTPSFVERYNAFIGQGTAAVEAFVARTQQAPLQTRQIDWVVTTAGGVPLGLACLADIDLENQRAELLIGFPELPGMRQKMVEATLLLLAAAFRHLKLQKLVSYVYQDNVPAQQATMHLGFQSEGVLRSHVRHRLSGDRKDLHVNGLLREDYFQNTYLMRMGKRTAGSRYPLDCLRLNADF